MPVVSISMHAPWWDWDVLDLAQGLGCFRLSTAFPDKFHTTCLFASFSIDIYNKKKIKKSLSPSGLIALVDFLSIMRLCDLL